MLTQTITYIDYNGDSVTEDHYFNLTMPELIELEMTTSGGYRNMLEKIVNAKNNVMIFKVFKSIIEKAYGIKTPDGKRFMKSKEISDAFLQSEAYVKLFMDVGTNAEKMAAFVNGIMPKEIQTNTKQLLSKLEEVSPNATNQSTLPGAV